MLLMLGLVIFFHLFIYNLISVVTSAAFSRHSFICYSRIFSPVEKRFQTNVPMMYNPTATLNTSSQEPAEEEFEKHTSN